MGPSATMPRVYLAGPGVFREDAAFFGKMLQEKCSRAGLDGCYPLDTDIAPDAPLETARAIYRANVALIDSASAIIADISPFRGPWTKARLGRSATGLQKACRYTLGRPIS